MDAMRFGEKKTVTAALLNKHPPITTKIRKQRKYLFINRPISTQTVSGEGLEKDWIRRRKAAGQKAAPKVNEMLVDVVG